MPLERQWANSELTSFLTNWLIRSCAWIGCSKYTCATMLGIHLCRASCTCCLHNQCPTCTWTLLYYDLFLAARSAPSQLCLHDTACSGRSYMMEYTERVQKEASEASPCLYSLIIMHVTVIAWWVYYRNTDHQGKASFQWLSPDTVLFFLPRQGLCPQH